MKKLYVINFLLLTDLIYYKSSLSVSTDDGVTIYIDEIFQDS